MILATVPISGYICSSFRSLRSSLAAFVQPGNYFWGWYFCIRSICIWVKLDAGYTPNPAIPAALAGLENTSLSDMGEDYYFQVQH